MFPSLQGACWHSLTAFCGTQAAGCLGSVAGGAAAEIAARHLATFAGQASTWGGALPCLRAQSWRARVSS